MSNITNEHLRDALDHPERATFTNEQMQSILRELLRFRVSDSQAHLATAVSIIQELHNSLNRTNMFNGARTCESPELQRSFQFLHDHENAVTSFIRGVENEVWRKIRLEIETNARGKQV